MNSAVDSKSGLLKGQSNKLIEILLQTSIEANTGDTEELARTAVHIKSILEIVLLLVKHLLEGKF